MRIDGALAGAAERLREVSENARLDAEVLLARALDLPRSYLFAHPDELLDENTAARFREIVERRREGLPLAYLTGEKEFWSLSLAVGPAVLVPRPETELLVEVVLRDIPRGEPCRVADLGTGSGAIALAIAKERPACDIVATDASPAALDTARHNAARHGLANIEFLRGDWTEPLGSRRFDIIVSNPPYIRAGDPALHRLRFEPEEALVSGSDGLDAIRRLARETPPFLNDGGVLVLEHGADQRDHVAGLLAGEGWVDIECLTDLAGHPRVTRARRPTR